jgi:hypothetical protein
MKRFLLRLVLASPLIGLVLVALVALFVPIVKAQSPAGAILLDWISGTIRDPGTGAVAPVSSTTGLAVHDAAAEASLATLATTGSAGGATAALQTAGNASLATVATNTAQGAQGLPVHVPDALSVAGSVTSATVLLSQDTTGYQSVSVAITSAGVSTVTYEVSNDNINWLGTVGVQVSNGGTAPFGATGGTGLYLFQTPARYFRARVSSYTSGTVSAVAMFRSVPVSMPAVYVGAGVVSATLAPTASSGLTPYRLLSAATTNAALAVSGAHSLFGVSLVNAGAAAAYLHLYNAATAPTCGSGTPVLTLAVPGGSAGAQQAWEFTEGVAFSAGMAFCLTGGLADADTTATALNQAAVNLTYR